MSDNYYPELSDTNLVTDLEFYRNEKIELERQLQEIDHILSNLLAEQSRRQLAAFWEAHPDLLRLEVGDKLVMTPQKHKTLDFDVRGGIYQVGNAYDIMNVYMTQGNCVVEFSLIEQGPYTEEYKQQATLEESQDMRHAYLAQQEQST